MFLYAPSLQLHKSFSVQPLSADPSGQWPCCLRLMFTGVRLLAA